MPHGLYHKCRLAVSASWSRRWIPRRKWTAWIKRLAAPQDKIPSCTWPPWWSEKRQQCMHSQGLQSYGPCRRTLSTLLLRCLLCARSISGLSQLASICAFTSLRGDRSFWVQLKLPWQLLVQTCPGAWRLSLQHSLLSLQLESALGHFQVLRLGNRTDLDYPQSESPRKVGTCSCWAQPSSVTSVPCALIPSWARLQRHCCNVQLHVGEMEKWRNKSYRALHLSVFSLKNKGQALGKGWNSILLAQQCITEGLNNLGVNMLCWNLEKLFPSLPQTGCAFKWGKEPLFPP